MSDEIANVPHDGIGDVVSNAYIEDTTQNDPVSTASEEDFLESQSPQVSIWYLWEPPEINEITNEENTRAVGTVVFDEPLEPPENSGYNLFPPGCMYDQACGGQSLQSPEKKLKEEDKQVDIRTKVRKIIWNKVSVRNCICQETVYDDEVYIHEPVADQQGQNSHGTEWEEQEFLNVAQCRHLNRTRSGQSQLRDDDQPLQQITCHQQEHGEWGSPQAQLENIIVPSGSLYISNNSMQFSTSLYHNPGVYHPVDSNAGDAYCFGRVFAPIGQSSGFLSAPFFGASNQRIVEPSQNVVADEESDTE